MSNTNIIQQSKHQHLPNLSHVSQSNVHTLLQCSGNCQYTYFKEIQAHFCAEGGSLTELMAVPSRRNIRVGGRDLQAVQEMLSDGEG